MNMEGKKVILAPKEGDLKEPLSSLSSAQPVFLLQNNIHHLREELIVETEEEEEDSRVIFLENRAEIRDPLLTRDWTPLQDEVIGIKKSAKHYQLLEEIFIVQKVLKDVKVEEILPPRDDFIKPMDEMLDPLRDCEILNPSYRDKAAIELLRHKKRRHLEVPRKLPDKMLKHKNPRRHFKKTIEPMENSPQQHVVRAKGFRIIRCQICEKSFKSSENLRNHISRSHLTCSICAKTCKSFDELEVHQQETHHCSLCQKIFLSKKTIETHRRVIHNVCHICSLGHSSRSELIEHISDQHPDCRHCGLMLRNRESYIIHEREHFQCSHCTIFFQSLEEKRTHFTVHHTCNICNKIFEYIPDLQSHSLVHLTCSICKMQFKSVVHKKEHLRRHHIRCNICSIIFRHHEDYTHHLKLTHSLIVPKRRIVPSMLKK